MRNSPPDELLYLDSTDVAELCRAIDPLDVVTQAFLAVRAGRAAVSPETSLHWTSGDGTPARSLILPASHDGSYGCKVINACIGNPTRDLPRAHGLIVLFDPETAAPACIMEGAYISALRTAAVSLVGLGAVRDLAGVREIALLGCGRQASTHLELLARRVPIESVILHDSIAERAEALALRARQLLPGARVELATSPEAAVRAPDVVIAATTTTTPYVGLDWLRPGAVFVNVSLDDATEEVLLGCDHLFVDDWSLVSDDDVRLLGRLAHAGRITGPDDPPPPGGRKVDADLATLLAGEYDREITAASSVVINPFGMGVHDVACAERVHAAARDRAVGTRLRR